ncbi:CheR family methyltransferase [Limnochorda pilosa]|uniref:Chemotaxis protein CheR n=1 Tax=Limnochorda pilosa TaxID=1555112 RepID=A0A0K2SHV3_LIMPI|nr:protein-glutamate O-methyltransferase CheR [Limnochorda pilosa]BAS26678.1 chemotaxis protein CheR [Limnochorda pilosa]
MERQTGGTGGLHDGPGAPPAAGGVPAAVEGARADDGGTPASDLAWAAFLRRCRSEIGLDLSAYKGTQLRRRIEQWMHRQGDDHYFALLRRLRQDAESRQQFVDYLGINTTSFFRDPQVFQTLEQTVLPRLILRPGPVRVWSAACSIGAEAYSVAMLLHELGGLQRAEILATDIDQKALEQGREGRFAEMQTTGLSAGRRARYLKPEGSGYRVDEALRRKVRFERLELLEDPYPSDVDLLLCRNLFIYLAQPTQERLTRRLVEALRPGGYLVLGGTEYVPMPARFGLERVAFCVYTRVEDAGA